MNSDLTPHIVTFINWYIDAIYMAFGILIAAVLYYIAQVIMIRIKHESVEDDLPIDIGKVNTEFRKHIERKLLRIEKRNKIKAEIKSRISAIFSKIRS